MISLNMIEPQVFRPDPWISKNEIDKQIVEVDDDKRQVTWFSQNLRFFLYNYYNRPAGSWSIDDPMENLRIVSRGVEFSRYLFGKQNNLFYKQFTTDMDNNNLQVRWEAGKEISNIYRHHLGLFEKQLGNKKITALTLSRDVVVERKAFIEAAMLQGSEEFMQVLGQIDGMSLNPLGTKENPKTPQKAAEMAMKKWKDKAADNAVKLAYSLQEGQFMDMTMKACFADKYAANFTGVSILAKNGKPEIQHHPFYNLFWEKATNDPFNRKMKAAGFIEQLTAQEILTRWSVNEQTAQEIKDAYMNITPNANYYNWPLFSWYGPATTSRAGTISVVTCFWVGPRHLNKKKINDKYGNVNYVKPRKNEKSELVTNDLYYCVFAGDRWILEEGLANNVIRSWDNKSNPEMPIKIFDGFNIMGDGTSMVGLMNQIQDMLDFLRFKIKFIMARDKGVVYLMDGSKLNSLIDNPKRLINDFGAFGFSVYNGASGEYGDVQFGDGELIKPLDFRLDSAAINVYTNQYAFFLNQMEKIASLSGVAMGQQTTYVSEKVRKASMEAAYTGLLSEFTNFTRYEEEILQYAVNLYILLLKGKKENIVIGKEGIDVLDVDGEWTLQDVLVYLKTDDVIDEERKLSLDGKLLAYLQNSGNPNSAEAFLTSIKMMKAETYQEAEDILEEYIEKAKKALDEANAQAQAMKVAEMQNYQQAVDKQESGATARKEMEVNSKMAVEAANLDAKEQEMQQPSA
jgi:hypothetical protein